MIKELGIILITAMTLLAGDSPLFRLFPNGTIKTLSKAPDKFTHIYGPIHLRNKTGFIPFKEVRTVSINDSVEILAFMIYLEDSEIPFEKMPLHHTPKGEREILLQVIAWNKKREAFIAKPADFPLSASQWTCYGDICDIVLLKSLKKVKANDRLVVIDYVTNTENSDMAQYILLSGNRLLRTKPIEIGSRVDWGEDLEYSISYSQEETFATGMTVVQSGIKKDTLFLKWQ